jgi:hypothetical protein
MLCSGAWLPKAFDQRTSFIGSPAGEEVVQAAAQAIDVDAVVDLATRAPLFRGHVVNRAHDPIGPRERSRPAGVEYLPRRSDQSGQAQIENLHGPLAVAQQVRGLDVPMDDPTRVGGLETVGGLHDVADCFGHGERTPALDQVV